MLIYISIDVYNTFLLVVMSLSEILLLEKTNDSLGVHKLQFHIPGILSTIFQDFQVYEFITLKFAILLLLLLFYNRIVDMHLYQPKHNIKINKQLLLALKKKNSL